MIDDVQIRELLDQTIDACPDIEGAARQSGKVREGYVFGNGTRAIVVTDRISAFDYILGTVPFKGQVLNRISDFWFAEMAKIGIPTHHISSPHPNVSVNREAEVLPVEFVVRGYLTGSTVTSSWYAYQNNDRRICGIDMPEGMVKNQIFPEPILTPTTKAGKGERDENISRDDILNRGMLTPDILARAEEIALTMFAHGQKIAAEKGLILVDTKYEMGLDADGAVMVVDEVHTPDSSRYWIAETYDQRMDEGADPDSLDKEFVRGMIVAAGYDVDSSDDPARFMSDDLRVAAAQKYLALFDIFLGGARPETPAPGDLERVLRAAGA